MGHNSLLWISFDPGMGGFEGEDIWQESRTAKYPLTPQKSTEPEEKCLLERLEFQDPPSFYGSK